MKWCNGIVWHNNSITFCIVQKSKMLTWESICNFWNVDGINKQNHFTIQSCEIVLNFLFIGFAFFRLVEGVFFCVIGGFGFLGNLTSILILVTPQVHNNSTYQRHNFTEKSFSSAVETHVQSVAGGSCSVWPDVCLLHRPHPRLPPLRVQQQDLRPPLQQVIHVVLFLNQKFCLRKKKRKLGWSL